jgi:hypothetical protein
MAGYRIINHGNYKGWYSPGNVSEFTFEKVNKCLKLVKEELELAQLFNK